MKNFCSYCELKDKCGLINTPKECHIYRVLKLFQAARFCKLNAKDINTIVTVLK